MKVKQKGPKRSNSGGKGKHTENHDNAVMECFFGIFKTEALRLYPPQTLAQARTLVHDYIYYYNTERML